MIIIQKIKHIIPVLISFLAVSITLSCEKAEMDRKDKVAAMVGTLQDPFLAITLTPQVFIDKAGVESGALPFAYQTVTSFLISKEKTGIANNDQMQVVVENSGGILPNAMAFIPLDNSSKFKELLENEIGKSTVKNGVHYIRKDKDNYVVAWKDDIAIVTNIPLSLDNLFSKGTNQSKKVAMRLVNLINGISAETIDTDFRQFFDKQGDVMMYANGNKAYPLFDGMPFISRKEKAEYKKMMSGTIIESALNFEDGHIMLDTDYELAEGVKTYFSILKDEGLSEDMLSQGFSSDPILAVSLNFSLPNFIKVLNMQRELFEVDDLESDLAEMNIDFNEIADLFTGEMLVMFDSMVTTSSTYTNYNGVESTYTSDSPIFGTVLGVKNTSKVTELMAQLALDGAEPGKIGRDYYLIKNNKLFITNSEEWLLAFESGKTVRIVQEDKMLSSGPIGVQVSSALASTMDLEIGETKAINEAIMSLAGKITDTGLKLTIKMKDGDKNALRVILEGMIEEVEKRNNLENSGIESLLDEEMLDQLESEIGKGVQDIIESEEMKDLQKVLESL